MEIYIVSASCISKQEIISTRTDIHTIFTSYKTNIIEISVVVVFIYVLCLCVSQFTYHDFKFDLPIYHTLCIVHVHGLLFIAFGEIMPILISLHVFFTVFAPFGLFFYD